MARRKFAVSCRALAHSAAVPKWTLAKIVGCDDLFRKSDGPRAVPLRPVFAADMSPLLAHNGHRMHNSSARLWQQLLIRLYGFKH